jgi:hypothetical protein
MHFILVVLAPQVPFGRVTRTEKAFYCYYHYCYDVFKKIQFLSFITEEFVQRHIPWQLSCRRKDNVYKKKKKKDQFLSFLKEEFEKDKDSFIIFVVVAFSFMFLINLCINSTFFCSLFYFI